MRRLPIVITILLVALLALAIYNFLSQDISLGEWLTSVRAQPWAPLAYVTVYTLVTLFGYPSSALTILAGPLFGLKIGFITVVLATNLSAVLSFGIARKLGSAFIQRLIPQEGKVAAMSHKLNKNGFQCIFILRFFPIIHFALFNYVSGLSPVKFSHYAWGTFLGKLPGLFIYVWFSTTVTEMRPIEAAMAGLILIIFLGAGYVMNKEILPRIE